MIKTSYLINKSTMALLPAKAIDFDTLVIESGKEIKVRQSALKLINHACIQYAWTTYEGRIQAVKVHTNFKHKIAVPITNDVLLFPIASPTHMDNVWLNDQHIENISEIDAITSLVIFKNGHTIDLPISHYALNQQRQRAYEISYRMQQKLTAKALI